MILSVLKCHFRIASLVVCDFLYYTFGIVFRVAVTG